MAEVHQKWTRDELTGFAAVLITGLVIRAALFTHSGLLTDTQIFEGWSARGAIFGVFSIYDRTLPGPRPDYPPLLLYVYSLVGFVVRELQGSFEHTKIFAAAIKAPAILADIGTLGALATFGRRLVSRQNGIIAGALFFLLPASWLDSTIWGQYDAVYSLLILISFFFAGERRPILAGCFAGLAITAKFQVIAFLPFLLLVAASAGWKDVWRGIAAFSMTIVVVLLPFIVTGHGGDVADAYGHAVGAYSVLSVDAFNIWRLIFGAESRRLSDLGHVAGISYRTWGFIAYFLALTAVMSVAWPRLQNATGTMRTKAALTVASIAAFLFFLFPTEIHERYLFAFVPLAAIWATEKRASLGIYILTSIVIALNIASVLPIASMRPLYEATPFLDRTLSGLLIALAIMATLMMLVDMPVPRIPHTLRRLSHAETLQHAEKAREIEHPPPQSM
jgi:Gpi18-like mannosyltransferase